MRPVVVTVTSGAPAQIVPINWNIDYIAFTLQCVLSGTATYKLEFTADENPSASGTWTAFAGKSNLSATDVSSWAVPVSGVRITHLSGTGSVTMTVLQATAAV